MATKERHRDRGARRAEAGIEHLCRELRDARRSLGLSQADVARAAGMSRAWVGRIELGKVRDVGVRTLSILLAIVGLDLAMRTCAAGPPLRDDGHRRLLARFRELLPPSAPWRTEVPLPIARDQRAWDAMTRLWRLRVAIEAETKPLDVQALERRLGLKLRDGGVDRLILVLADTRDNRAFVRAAGEGLRSMFPLQGSPARRALRSSEDPGCNLLVLV